MRRRQFISLFGGVAMWPLAARAQKPDRVRRIGVLMAFTACDAEGLHRGRTIAQELQGLGWTDGHSARIDYRWPGGDVEQIKSLELVSLRPDVLVADGKAQAVALRQATWTIPIVFLIASDPVGLGIVESLPLTCCSAISPTRASGLLRKCRSADER